MAIKEETSNLKEKNNVNTIEDVFLTVEVK